MNGSLSFDVQGWERLPQFGPIRTDRRRGGAGVQKLDIFPGCHKCMVPKLSFQHGRRKFSIALENFSLKNK